MSAGIFRYSGETSGLSTLISDSVKGLSERGLDEMKSEADITFPFISLSFLQVSEFGRANS